MGEGAGALAQPAHLRTMALRSLFALGRRSMGVVGEERQTAAAAVVHEPPRRGRVEVGGVVLPQPSRGSGGWKELREWMEWRMQGSGNQGGSVWSLSLSSGIAAPQRMGKGGAGEDQLQKHSSAHQC